MRRSIAELCVADHKNDAAILARWLGNKTVKNFVAWIEQPDNSLMVAVEDGKILAVGSVTDFSFDRLELRIARRPFSWRKPRYAARPGGQRFGAQESPMHADEHRDCSPVLPVERLLKSGAAVGAFGTASGYPMSKPLVRIRLT